MILSKHVLALYSLRSNQ